VSSAMAMATDASGWRMGEEDGEIDGAGPVASASTVSLPTSTNSVSVGSCNGYRAYSPPFVARTPPPSPWNTSPQHYWITYKNKAYQDSNGETYYRITYDVEVNGAFRSRNGLNTWLQMRVSNPARGEPYRGGNANERDDGRPHIPRKPFYYHASLYVYKGAWLYFRSGSRWSPSVHWTGPGPNNSVLVYDWWGPFTPISPWTWLKCKA
jgi:hypothetical protein